MTSNNSSNTFLLLPTEIRLEIYSHVLTNSQPVYGTTISTKKGGEIIHIPKLHTRSVPCEKETRDYPASPEEELNQLRYVCRQTCQETRGLSLGYNHIVVESKGTVSAREICSRFLSSIASTHHRKIQRIDIVEAPRRPVSPTLTCMPAPYCYAIGQVLTGAEYPAIHAFCRANRKHGAKVFLRLDLMSRVKNELLDGARLIFVHAALRMALRGSSAVERSLGNNAFHFRWLIWLTQGVICVHMMRYRMGSLGVLDNFRVSCSTVWTNSPTWTLFSEQYSRRLPMPGGDWLQIAKREFEEGC